MSHVHRPPDPDPADSQPTQQFWAGPDAPTAMPGWGSQPGVAGPPGPGHTGLPAPSPRKHHKALHWTAGLLAAALLAGGGTIAGMRLAAHSSPGTSSGVATGPASTASQGALLNETLSGASSPGALTGTGASTGGAAA